MLRTMFWVRVFIVSAIVMGVLIASVLHAYPNTVIPWTRVALTPLVTVVMLMLVIGLNLFFPRHIELRKEWIRITHGQHVTQIKRDRLQRVELINIKTNQPSLRVEYIGRKGTLRTVICAVGNSVDIEKVCAFLGEFENQAQFAQFTGRD